jgi:DNA repair protein RadC
MLLDNLQRGNCASQYLVGRRWIGLATFAHNHPSGVAQPSRSDELLTRNLREALALVEVKVLDHFVVAGNQAISFAERGLL